uniref:SPARC-related modular calcium-binding protein 1-like n=1 Tax=Myxine glutinosa TaxID=7769 RepID=UPI00358F08A3
MTAYIRDTVSRCQTERNQAQKRVRKPQDGVFVPDCNQDGTYKEVQCHSYTTYCWCVRPDGRPISGTSVKNKRPKCTAAAESDKAAQSDRNPNRKDDNSKSSPTPESKHRLQDGVPELINAPALWRKQLPVGKGAKAKDKTTNCDQNRQSAQEEAKLKPHHGIFVPECNGGALYKAVQCHQSTSYCWCVYIDSGRPVPGSSTRYKKPKCNNNARAHSSENPYDKRDLYGCPGIKKNQFITSVLDALITDMVKSIKVAGASSRGRIPEPDPTQTLEERAVDWFFKSLDRNKRGIVVKRDMKRLKRFLKKRPQPRPCGRKFVEYCDVDSNKALSLPELRGCLGLKKQQGERRANQRQHRRSRRGKVRRTQ